MAIVKTGSRIDRKNIYSSPSDRAVKNSSRNSEINFTDSSSYSASSSSLSSSSSSSSSDSSDAEKALNPSSHLCGFEDKVSEFPLELFHLSDLTQILSVEAWNSILSEEDRENLVSLLPQIEEEYTLKNTLKELLSGGFFNFTSPLQDLLNLLKSGQCNPRIRPYQNALMSLRRREHHHYVRKYHNHMVNGFLEMNDLWQDYPHSTIEEKMEIWKNWKLKKVRPPPLYAGERKEGSFQSFHLQNLLSRKAKVLLSKEKNVKSLNPKVPGKFVLDSVDSKSSKKKQKKGAIKIGLESTTKTMAIDKKNSKVMRKLTQSGNVSSIEKTEKQPPKGVLKLLPKALGKDNEKKMIESSLNASPPHSLSPFDEMQMVPSSIYHDVGDYVEDTVITSSGMYEPVLMMSQERMCPAPVKEEVKEKVPSMARVKTPGDKRTKMMVGDVEEKGTSVSKMFETLNDSLEEVVDIANQDLDLSRGLEDENLDMGLSPIIVQEAKILSSSLGSENGVENSQRAKRKMKKKINAEEQTPLENRKEEEKEKNEVEDEDEDSRMRRDLSREAYLAEKEMQDILDDKTELETEEKPVKRRRKRLKPTEEGAIMQCNGEVSLSENATTPSKSSRKSLLPIPPSALSFPFSVLHLLSAVRSALISHPLEGSMLLNGENSYGVEYLIALEQSYIRANDQSFVGDNTIESIGKDQQEKSYGLPAIPLHEIVRRIQANPGDPRILETQEPLQELVRGVLKVLSSKAMQPYIKGWKPLVAYNKEIRGWSWIGPLLSATNNDALDVAVEVSHEVWSVPPKTLYKLQEGFGKWWKHEQEILQHLGQIALLPLPVTIALLDEKERFRELRAQKSLITINPTSEEMKAYFRREEALRYSVPDRAFSYTCLDGRKSAVAPLRRIGGKPNSKARDHFMLKSDRPPHVTILCLVRDAASRLPGGIGTRADVCSLIRDSQYIVEEVSDVQLNQVVSGALDRLHYERDPCVRFDGDRKLWVYLHSNKDDEDFEDDATSSTKRWKRAKKDGTENPENVENPDFGLTQDYDYPTKEDNDSCALVLDFNHDLSSVYSSVVGGELLFAHPTTGSLILPHGLESAFSGQGRDDSVLPFIELPPSIQPSCVNMQQSHPMGWEVLGNRWGQEAHFQSSNDHIVQDDFSASSHRDSEIAIDRGV